MKKLATLSLLALHVALSSCAKIETDAEQNIDQRAAQILSEMTLEEKIGQVIQADISAVSPEDLKTYNLGSVLNGGNSAPGGGKVAPPEDWIALADAFWIASTDSSDGGVAIPAIWGTDAVHGHNNLQAATIFPHNSALGATNDPELMKEIGRITAAEIRATGLDWTFAPTLAVARDDRWGRAYESYSENPNIVAAYAKAMVEGLQGEQNSVGFLKGQNVMATAKHFVGDGGTQLGIDKGDAIGDIAEIIDIHAAGYKPAFDAGVQSVMASFSSVNGEKMHGSKHLLTDVLRGEMGFTGFVVGDWNGHAEVPGCTATDCPQALEAGIDMYMAPDSWRGLYDSLLDQAKSGELSMESLDTAILRILRVKIRSGLMDAGLPSSRKSADPKVLGNESHGDVAQEAVRKSLVLLKNDGDVLPLNPNQKVLITGSGADSMQQQTGGWTLNWQGDGNPNDIFHTGETIFDGLAAALKDGNAVLSSDGSYESKPDVAVVIYGEHPYAEYRGDRSDVVYEFDDGDNLQLIRKYKADGIPVISVFLTGRPLWVNPHINASDSFVVAWLPGTEGEGVADVLVADDSGKVRYDFTGRLSFSWPNDGTGKPINDARADGVLYPFGYGLDYTNKSAFKALSEDPSVANIGSSFKGQIITRGDASNSLGLYLGDSSNQNTPVTSLTGKSLGGGISVKGTDYKAQEDSRILTWSGNGLASARVRTRRALDLTSLGDLSKMSLKLTWRLDDAPDGPISIGMGCGDGCGSQLDISNLIAQMPKGEWTSSSIPVQCFTKAGSKPENIDTLLQLTADTETSLVLHAAEIVPSAQNGTCPQAAQ